MLQDGQLRKSSCTLKLVSYNHIRFSAVFQILPKKILGYFRFESTVYGIDNSRKNRKWWNALREERARDIETKSM